MQKLLKPGRVIFATGIIALGMLCIVFKDFIVGRPPAWPASFTLAPVLGYTTALVLAVAGVFIITRKYAASAALLVAVTIFLFSVCRHLPQFMRTWPNAYKSIALVGGCLIIAAACSREDGTSLHGFLHYKNLVSIGKALLAIFLLVCGYSHFKYAAFVDTLIPDYIPFHSFWTYFCGVCLLAGGLGLFIPRTINLAALFSGIMIGGWFLLLHVPRFFANPQDTSDRLGLCESFTFCGIFFVLAALTAKEKQVK